VFRMGSEGGKIMARKTNTSKSKTRPKRKDRKDYTRETMLKLREHEQDEVDSLLAKVLDKFLDKETNVS